MNDANLTTSAVDDETPAASHATPAIMGPVVSTRHAPHGLRAPQGPRSNHGTAGTHGIHATHGNHGTHGNHSTHATHGPHGLNGPHSTRGAPVPHPPHISHVAHEPLASITTDTPSIPDGLPHPTSLPSPFLLSTFGKLTYPDHGDATLQAIYACAQALCENHRHEQAERLFRQLCVYDFHNADYVLGLGAVFQWKGDYEGALDLYGMAYATNDQDPCYLYHAAKCHLVLRQLDQARKCLEVAQSSVRGSQQDRAKATALLVSMRTLSS